MKFEIRKPVSPYICSTPLDFTEERQYISDVVFPQLNDLCKSRGSYFNPVDIRWKPGDQKTQGGLLLKTQLDSIKKCSPFFIGLLGETYGPYRSDNDPPLTSPKNGHKLGLVDSSTWLDKNLLLAGTGGHSWVLLEGHQSSSLSELEVTQGAFLCDSQHVTLYYRQSDHLDDKLHELQESDRNSKKDDIIALYSSESDHAKMKIHDLRQRLVNKGVPVKYFRTLEELGELVLEDWLEIIDMVLPPLPYDIKLLETFEYKEWLAQESFIMTRSMPFVSVADVEKILQQLTDFALTCSKAEVKGEDGLFDLPTPGTKFRGYSATEMFKKRSPLSNEIKSILLLSGDRGVGKSSLAAHWLQEFRADHSHMCIISHFVSASSNSADIVDFLQHCIQELRRKYLLSDAYDPLSIYAEIESESDGDGKSFQALCEAFVAAIALGPCVILLDGLNEFGDAHGLNAREVKEFAWLSDTLPPTCKFIFTTARSDITYRCLAKRQDVIIVNFPASLTDVNSTVVMVKEHQPTISQLLGGEHVTQKLSKLKIMQTALGSRIVGSEVACYRVYKNMGAFMENCTEIWSLRDFWIMCVQNWVKEHSWTIDFPTSEVNFVDNGFDYTGWVTDSLCLIALSRNGLTQDQILAILYTMGYDGELEVSVYDWLQFKLAAGATFRELGDGRLVFSHRYIQEITEYLFFKSFSSISYDPETIMHAARSQKRQVYHGHLARFFSQQLIDTQVMDELPWQLMLSGNIICLIDYLTDCGALLRMLGAESRQWQQDLKLYWSVCHLHGHHPGTVYLQLTHALGVVDINDVQMLEDSLSQASRAASPAPRVVVSTPQPSDYSDVHDSVDNSYVRRDSDNLFLPLAEVTEDDAMKRKISAEPMAKDFDDTQIFVTQGGGGDSVLPTQLHVNEEDKNNFPGVASLCWHIARFLQELGEHEASKVLLSSLVNYIKHNYPLTLDQQLLLCRCHHAVGTLYEMMDRDLTRAEREYRLALHAVVAADDMDDELEYQRETKYLKGVLLSCHGNLRVQEEDFHEAEELLKEALECVEDNQDCFVLKSTIYYNLALLRAAQSDFLRGESCLRESGKLRSQWFGRCHPLVAEVLVALAKLLATPVNVKGFDINQAEALFRQALSILEKCNGVTHLSVASVLFALGEVLAEDKSHPAKVEAQKFLRRSLDIRTTKLGGHHPVTMATQQSLTRLDVALKLGHYEFGTARHSDRRGNNAPFSALTFREGDLARLQSWASSQGSLRSLEGPLMVRAVSREDVLRHNRPDSILSAVSLISASERLLSAPVTERPRLLKREKEPRVVRQSSLPHQVGTDHERERQDEQMINRLNEQIIIGSVDSKGRRVIVGDEIPPSESGREDGSLVRSSEVGEGKTSGDQSKRYDVYERQQGISIDIHSKGETDKSEDADADLDALDTPHLESYADVNGGEASSSEKKSVTIRPSSAPRRMFQRFGSGKPINAPTPTAPKAQSYQRYRNSKTGATTPIPTTAKSESSHSLQRLWSGRSNMTVASTASGHGSRCTVPGPHDITSSNTRTVTGPNSSLNSLLGDPPCPRPSSNKMHHRSAWYHVAGRYSTPQERYPKKRMQKTENAKDIEAFMGMKNQWVNKKQEEARKAKLKAQKEELAQAQIEQRAKSIDKSRYHGAGLSYQGPTYINYNRFGSRQRLIFRPNETPRFMISGLDIVPESRYSENYHSSQSHVVKFKEPIVVG